MIPATNAWGETVVAPNSATIVATNPTVGNENEKIPLVLRNEKRRYVDGNAAYNEQF